MEMKIVEMAVELAKAEITAQSGKGPNYIATPEKLISFLEQVSTKLHETWNKAR